MRELQRDTEIELGRISLLESRRRRLELEESQAHAPPPLLLHPPPLLPAQLLLQQQHPPPLMILPPLLPQQQQLPLQHQQQQMDEPVRYQDLWKRVYLPKLGKSKPHEYAALLALAAAPGKSPVGTPIIHIFGVPPLVMARDLPGVSADDGECRGCSGAGRVGGKKLQQGLPAIFVLLPIQEATTTGATVISLKKLVFHVDCIRPLLQHDWMQPQRLAGDVRATVAAVLRAWADGGDGRFALSCPLAASVYSVMDVPSCFQEALLSAPTHVRERLPQLQDGTVLCGDQLGLKPAYVEEVGHKSRLLDGLKHWV